MRSNLHKSSSDVATEITDCVMTYDQCCRESKAVSIDLRKENRVKAIAIGMSTL